MAQALGTAYYHSAIFTVGTYLLNPAALVRGLADTLPANVRIFEQSPVIRCDFSGDEKIVYTPTGSICCGGVIIAVNSFLSAFGLYRWRQVTMVLYGYVERTFERYSQRIEKVLRRWLALPYALVLSAARRLVLLFHFSDYREMAQLGSVRNWGITPAHGTVGATLRLTADRRLLIRHDFRYSPKLREQLSDIKQVQQSHLAMLGKRFSQIQATAAHTWQGWLPISHNHMPIFGEAQPHVFVVSCCNGAGLVRHSAAGKLIADQALVIDNPDIRTYLADGQASLLPPRPLLDIGVHLSAAWQLWRGRREQ